MDVTGLLPVNAGELAGGKVSLFTFCGEPPDDLEYIGFQKMDPDYRDGHIFRYPSHVSTGPHWGPTSWKPRSRMPE